MPATEYDGGDRKDTMAVWAGNETVLQARAVATMSLRRWRRSRMPWIWAVFIAVCIGYDWAVGPRGPGPGSWALWLSLTALVGFLAGYDTFIEPREEGFLRTFLLQPVSQFSLLSGAFFAALVPAFIGLGAFALYLLLFSPPAPKIGVSLAVIVGVAGCLVFLAYAEAASLVLGRDVAAVVGLLVVFAGSGPADRYFPPGTPGWVRDMAEGTFYALPSVHRLQKIVGLHEGAAWDAVLVLFQMIVALSVAYWLLGRPALLRRQKNEA